jgi:hypothetical protein
MLFSKGRETGIANRRAAGAIGKSAIHVFLETWFQREPSPDQKDWD